MHFCTAYSYCDGASNCTGGIDGFPPTVRIGGHINYWAQAMSNKQECACTVDKKNSTLSACDHYTHIKHRECIKHGEESV